MWLDRIAEDRALFLDTILRYSRLCSFVDYLFNIRLKAAPGIEMFLFFFSFFSFFIFLSITLPIKYLFNDVRDVCPDKSNEDP